MADALKGNHGSDAGAVQAPENSGRGSKPWSRPSVRGWKIGSRNRHEGRERETGTAPAGGQAPKCESRERRRKKTLPARSNGDQTVKRVETRKADRAWPQGLARTRSIARAVETEDLRRAIVNGRSSRGARRAKTRRADPMLGGTPFRTSESGRAKAESEPVASAPAERAPGESREERGDGSYQNPWKPGQSRTRTGRCP